MTEQARKEQEMEETKQVEMLHYPALLEGLGDPGYIIFAACSIREEVLEDEDTQAMRLAYNEDMWARGNYDESAAESILTSADLFETVAEDRLGNWETNKEGFREEFAAGDRFGLEEYALELGCRLPDLDADNVMEILRLGAEGEGEEAARAILAISTSRVESGEALKGEYLGMDEFSEDGEDVLLERARDEDLRRLEAEEAAAEARSREE